MIINDAERYGKENIYNFAQKFILIKLDERLAPKHWMYEC